MPLSRGDPRHQGLPEIGKRFAEEAREKAIGAREPIRAEIERRGYRLLDEGGSA